MFSVLERIWEPALALEFFYHNGCDFLVALWAHMEILHIWWENFLLNFFNSFLHLERWILTPVPYVNLDT